MAKITYRAGNGYKIPTLKSLTRMIKEADTFEALDGVALTLGQNVGCSLHTCVDAHGLALYIGAHFGGNPFWLTTVHRYQGDALDVATNLLTDIWRQLEDDTKSADVAMRALRA